MKYWVLQKESVFHYFFTRAFSKMSAGIILNYHAGYVLGNSFIVI